MAALEQFTHALRLMQALVCSCSEALGHTSCAFSRQRASSPALQLATAYMPTQSARAGSQQRLASCALSRQRASFISMSSSPTTKKQP